MNRRRGILAYRIEDQQIEDTDEGIGKHSSNTFLQSYLDIDIYINIYHIQDRNNIDEYIEEKTAYEIKEVDIRTPKSSNTYHSPVAATP